MTRHFPFSLGILLTCLLITVTPSYASGEKIERFEDPDGEGYCYYIEDTTRGCLFCGERDGASVWMQCTMINND